MVWVNATSASSGGADGFPVITSTRMNPTKPGGLPFASLVPTVNDVESWTGGRQEGNARGGPCVRFGAKQPLYEGTSESRRGVAPFGRGYPPVATSTVVSSVSE